MKGASKVIMAATLVMVVSLAIVLGLILVLLAELYCTLLLRRRQLRIPSSNGVTAASTATITISPAGNATSPQPPQHQNRPPSPSTTYYAPGVLEVESPRNLFYPSKPTETRNQRPSHLHHILKIHTQESNSSPQHIGLIKAPPLSISPGDIEIQINATDKACGNGGCGGGGGEPFVYISNPIYNNDGSRVETPFETPDSSPSRLETYGASSGDEERPATPPLTPMEKLPAEACSVSLRDARSLETSGSDSGSHNGRSSSSLGSPCTSPSW